MKRSWLVLGSLLLLVIAAVPRFSNLGRLGFTGDEELTAFAATALRDQGRPAMPSGLPYPRALPFTALNAVTLGFLDEREERSHRALAAAFGTATPAAAFLVGAPLLGAQAAFTGSLLLALSDKHMRYSRRARMYAPFLFFFLLASLTWWLGVTQADRRWMVFSIVSGLAAATLNKLAVLLVVAAYLPALLFLRSSRAGLVPAALASVMTVSLSLSSHSLAGFLIGDPSLPAELQVGIPGTSFSLASLLPRIEPLLSGRVLPGLGFLLGTGAGIWLARRVCSFDRVSDKPYLTLWNLALAALAGGFAGLGFFHASGMLFLLLFLGLSTDASSVLRPAAAPILTLTLLAAVGFLANQGPTAPMEGLKAALFFPFPVVLYYGQNFPGAALAFAGALLLGGLKGAEGGTHLRMTLWVTVALFLAVGIVTDWTPFRYTLPLYPFFLLGAGWGGLEIVRRISKLLGVSHGRAPFGLLLLLVVAGGFTGHGILQARAVVTHSYSTAWPGFVRTGWPAYPDHQGAGAFVRGRLGEDHLVVAEDATMQAWYVGRVDYWLRNPRNHARYTYVDDQGTQRDLYTRAELATGEVLADLCRDSSSVVWVITSGETYGDWDLYLEREQQDWLRSLRQRTLPAYVGRGGMTEVFQLDCEGSGSQGE